MSWKLIPRQVSIGDEWRRRKRVKGEKKYRESFGAEAKVMSRNTM